MSRAAADSDVRRALELLAGIGDHRFDVQIGMTDRAGWTPAERFADPSGGVLLDGAQDDGRWGGPSGARVAASVLTQVYANRLVGLGIGCWVGTRIVPVLAPPVVLIGREGPRPVRTALREARAAASGDDALAALGNQLFDGHLAAVVEGVRARSRLSARRLWGNIATSCATAFVLLHRAAPASRRSAIGDDARAFFAVRDWPIHDLVEWTTTSGRHAPLTYRRRTCCLMRMVPGDAPCSTCSLPAPRQLAATS